MNDLITDVKSLEIETLKNLKNSKAHNTLRAYQSDFKDFSAFCKKKWIIFNSNTAKSNRNLHNTFI